MTDGELSSRTTDVEVAFRDLLEKTPIHPTRWKVLLVVLVTLPSLLFGGGWWYVSRSACQATNRATNKVERVVDRLTTPATLAHGAGPPLQEQTRAANDLRASVRGLTHDLLQPEGC